MQITPAPSALQPANTQYWGVLLAPTLVFALIGLARVIYVSLYAVPLPYWDQWDELYLQIGPLFNGTWHFMELFAPHSEHRIVFTHLVGFFLAWVNHHRFDNLVESYFNALIYALLWTTLYCLFVNREKATTRRWLIAVVIIILGALPFDWENIVTGFQNQFYLLELAAVALIGIAAYRDFSGRTVTLLAIVALAGLFTMASGALAAPAAGLAIVLRAWREPIRKAPAGIALAILMVVMVIGLVLLRHTPGYLGNSWIHAHDAAEFGKTLLVTTMWPFRTHHIPLSIVAALLIWSPSLVWACVFCKTRRGDASEIFAATLCGWVLLQCLAMAYDRGANMETLTSRYTEITAIGIVANVWLALKLGQRTPGARWPRVTIGVAMVLVVGTLVIHNSPRDLAQIELRHTYTTIETRNIQRYFAGVPLPSVPAYSQDLPYPQVHRLRQMLESHEVRAVLPPSAFPQSDPAPDAPLSAWAASLQRSIRWWFPKTAWTADSNTRP